MTEIRVSRRFQSMDLKIQSQNIGDQLATILYGSPMNAGQNGVLGRSQSVRVSSINGPITIYIPSLIMSDSACATHLGYIRNMSSHGRSKGVQIEIVECCVFGFLAKARKRTF